ncbi:hypothetical protein GWI33_016920 [Rhynchophorus ferrugineus]|uniref:Uncharacterized protein n=1 Tax=Rhynchophorus ferrugineus TaxID=354439 RepID=A0A834M9T6_RHYFE|nr:hypothetical protein GWI33_016920 [Rhynchophorus ferrugineus]
MTPGSRSYHVVDLRRSRHEIATPSTSTTVQLIFANATARSDEPATRAEFRVRCRRRGRVYFRGDSARIEAATPLPSRCRKRGFPGKTS